MRSPQILRVPKIDASWANVLFVRARQILERTKDAGGVCLRKVLGKVSPQNRGKSSISCSFS